MKRVLSIVVLAVCCYLTIAATPGWVDDEVSILVTYTRRHVAGDGYVLLHLPRVTISQHALRKNQILFLLGDDYGETPLKAETVDGKPVIKGKEFVERLQGLIEKANKDTRLPIPKNLVSGEFTMLNLNELKAKQKVMEIFLRDAPPEVAAGQGKTNGEAKPHPVMDSILVQIGTADPADGSREEIITTEFKRYKDGENKKLLYEKHYHAIPLKVSLFKEVAGAPPMAAKTNTGDTSFYVVKHRTLTDEPQLVIPDVLQNGKRFPVAYNIPSWTVPPTQTEVQFDLPAKPLIDGIITAVAGTGEAPIPIIPEDEAEKKLTQIRKKTFNGREEIVIEGILPLGSAIKPGATTTVVFHMDDPKDVTLIYRAELSIGTFPTPSPEAFMKGSTGTMPVRPAPGAATPAELK